MRFGNPLIQGGENYDPIFNQVLKAERPDIGLKRSNLLKHQGEFELRPRHLAKNLFTCFNEAKGRILVDNNVINTLETLKAEAAELGRKVDKMDDVMADIENTACSSTHFTIKSLHQTMNEAKDRLLAITRG